MPGDQYFDSIVNFWRVYGADEEAAASACERFLAQVVNVQDYPLTRLPSTIASETAKILENSYRATTIAFIEEWGRFAEAAGIDLFEVIDAIRLRPTHSNMRQPGFGVGGYCLTKDPLFASVAVNQLLGLGHLSFPFSERAIEVNREMPLVSVDRLRSLLSGTLRGRRILLLGVSYRHDVGDTRYSPSEAFYRAAVAAGAEVVCHDPLVRRWHELGIDVLSALPPASRFDGVVFAVPHRDYRANDWVAWTSGARPAMLDANHVLSKATIAALREAGCRVAAIGSGA
jgi:nucleotide sugar dehydrogenase